MNINRNTTAIIFNAYAAINIDMDLDVFTKTCKSFIDAVVNKFIDEVM